MRGFIIAILVAVTLAGCATAAQRQASTIKTVVLAASKEMNECNENLYFKPDYASLRPHLFSPENKFLPSIAQLSDDTYPTQAEAKLFAAFYDDHARCERPLIERIGSVAPTVALVLTDTAVERDRIALQIVKRQITWGEGSRRAQTVFADDQRKLVAASQELDNNLNASHQAELAQRQAAANALMQWSMEQQMINAATRPVVTTCSPAGNGFVDCISH
jgi:hypothetical protein